MPKLKFVPLMLRLPENLHRAVKRRAKKNKRSLNAELVWMVYRIERQDNWALAPPEKMEFQALALEFIEFMRPKLIRHPQPRD